MYDLIHQYVIRETQISVKYDYQDDIIPGITVCFPKALSMMQFIRDNSTDIESRYWPDFLEDILQLDPSMSKLDEDDLDNFNRHFQLKYKQDAKFKENYDKLVKYLSKAYGEVTSTSETNFFQVLYLSLLMHMTTKDTRSMLTGNQYNCDIL